MRMVVVAATLAVAVIVGSCETATAPVQAASFEYSGPVDTAIPVGGTAQFHAVARDRDGNAIPDYPFTWSSSDESVAMVDQTGLARGLRAGTTVITARDRNGAVGRPLTVTEPVVSVAVTPNPARVLRGGTVQLVATPLDALGRLVPHHAIIWATGDSAVATVDARGLVTGIALGTAPITATTEGTTGTAEMRVIVVRFGAVGAGARHTCALAEDSTAYCWGANDQDQLGDSSYGHTAPAPVPGGLRFASLSAGYAYTCALTATGAAYCWGSNEERQLGWGSAAQPIGPVPVTGGSRFSTLSAAFSHTCGVSPDQMASCWGLNWSGELGAFGGEVCDVGKGIAIDCSSRPVGVAGRLAFRAVSAGGAHSCGLAPDGVAYCWGANGSGEIGDGTTETRNTPTPVAGGLAFQLLVAGGTSNRSCALTLSGSAYCWGAGDSVPVAVPGELTFRDLSVGHQHICGVVEGGGAYCWGSNAAGQLGNGSSDSSLVPVPVVGGLSFEALSAGFTHTCGLTSDGRIYCWGDDTRGQLGTSTAETCPDNPSGGTLACSTKPVPVTGQP